MRKMWLLMAAGLMAGMCLLAGNVVRSQASARADDTDGEGDEGDEAPAITAQHKLLEKFVGQYTFSVKVPGPDGKQMEVSKGTSTRELVLGGRFLEMRDTEGGGKPGEQRGDMSLVGYDPETKKFSSVDISSNENDIKTQTGTYSEETKSFTMTGKVKFLGQPADVTDVVSWKEDGTELHTATITANGMSIPITVTYAKVKKAEGAKDGDAPKGDAPAPKGADAPKDSDANKPADAPKGADAKGADATKAEGHSEAHGGPKDTVGPEHKVLEGMIANFACVSKGFNKETGQATVTKGTVTREMIFEGRFLRETGNEAGAKSNNYVTTIGYNAGGKKWELTYISTEMTGMAYMSGTYDAAGKLFTFKGDFNGMPMKYTISVAANGDETHKLFGAIVMGPPGTPATETEFFSTAYTKDKMPTNDEMNKAWMEYAKPCAEHKRLTDMVGTFDVVMDCPAMGEMMPASKWTGTSEITKDESGMFVTEHMVISTPATDKIPEGANKMDMTLLFSYHGGHKRYEVCVRMAQASGMQMMTGVWDKEKKAMVLEGMMWEPALGKDVPQKVEATEMKDGKSTVTIFANMSGAWTPVGTSTYTKKK